MKYNAKSKTINGDKTKYNAPLPTSLKKSPIYNYSNDLGFLFKKEKIVVINPTHNGVKTNKINPAGLFMLSYAAAKIIKLSTNPNPRIIKV